MEKINLDGLTQKYTGFHSFEDLVETNIIPTIASKPWDNHKEAKQLAKAFNRAKRKRGSTIRAFQEKDIYRTHKAIIRF